jgi:hypothetical protein
MSADANNVKKPAANSQDGNSSHEPRMKGERMVDRIIPIRLYPNARDTGSEPEEIIFTTVVDPNKSEKVKTNLRELKIQKIELLTDNAEAYCSLMNKLRSEKWDREAEDKCSFWTRSKDFADCISSRSKYTFEAACGQLMARVADGFEKDFYLRKDNTAKLTTAALRSMSIWKFQAVYEKDRALWDLLVKGSVADVTEIDEEGDEVVDYKQKKFLTWLEREFWEDMARTVFREPHNAYRTQMKYLTGDIQKPFKESFSSYKARVEQVFNYLEDFPAPCLRGERPDEEDYNQVKEPVELEVVRLAIFESLPARWRDMYDNRETSDCRKLSEAEFMATMVKIEEQELAARAAAKKAKPAPSTGSRKRSGGNGTGNDGGSQNGNRKRKKRFCQKCKDLGRTELAYTSHDESYCKASREAGPTNNNNNNGNSSGNYQPSKKEWKKVLHVMDKLSKTALDSDTDAS